MKKYLKFILLFPFLYILYFFTKNRGFSLLSDVKSVFTDFSPITGSYKNFQEIVKKHGLYPIQNDRPCVVSSLSHKDFFYKFAPALKTAKDKLGFSVPLTWLLAHSYIETGAGNSSLVCFNNFTGVKEYNNKDNTILRWTWEFFSGMNIPQAQQAYDKYASAMIKKGIHVKPYGFFYDETRKGTWIYCLEPFRKDNSMVDGFVHYISLLQRKYKHDTSSPYNWSKSLSQQGYGGADSHVYANSIVKHVEQFEKLF